MFTALRILLIAALAAAAFASAADAHKRYHRHSHDDGFDLGDAIVGAAVLGGIIAAVNAGKKEREREREAERGAEREPDWHDRRGYPDERRSGGRGAAGGWDDGWNGGSEWSHADRDYDRRFPSERAAISACAYEAEALGGRYGGDARVTLIDDVEPEGRDYRVTGTVRIEDERGYRDDFADFTCYADEGRVTGFQFG